MDRKTPPNQPSPPRVQVKKENEEEIKEFAETAMNELLGWYGYERLELRRWAASRARDTASPEQAGEQKNKDECSWCNKSITGEGGGGALQQAGAAFCSELCFSQSRRANFKRAKTCDWCRHVRHTVAYVDFQDGATQLQFCSDKCLNQYKMHIFCRETQAHLDQNPHLVNASSSSSLITPDLWLKNCKSRSASPNSEPSASPNPETPKHPEKPEPKKSPLPLITVAPTAKLMKQKRCEDTQKSPEAKKETRNKMNLRKRRTSKCSATVTSRQRSTTPKAQDLRLCPPETSSPSSTAVHSPPHHPPPPPPPIPNPMFLPPFMDGHHINEMMHPGMGGNMFPPRMPFMPRHMQMPERPRLPPPLNFPQPLGQPPPVTVLVPYPVILPLPIPIPIPMPLSAFVRAHCASKVKSEVKVDDEGPLDFTMNNKREDDTNSNNSEPVEATEPNDRIEEERSDSEATETRNPEQTLPKFKITRLGNKMSKIVTKAREPCESSRPLRKRRRLVEVAAEDETLISKTRKIVQV